MTSSRHDHEDEPARQRRRLMCPSNTLDINYHHGCPLFHLLELVPRIPQLDNVSLLRSVYDDADQRAVEDEWEDWFYKVIRTENNNSDRCRILETTFRIVPELATRKVTPKSTIYSGEPFFPLYAILCEWRPESSIPIELLDLAWGNNVDLDCAEHWGGDDPSAPRLPGSNIVHYIFRFCRCSNKSDVAMWVLRSNFRFQHVHASNLTIAIERNFSEDVVLALVETVLDQHPSEGVIKSEFSSAVAAALRFSSNPPWSERLLRSLWEHSEFKIHLGWNIPLWFMDMVVAESREQSRITLVCSGNETAVNSNMAFQVLREMTLSQTLGHLQLQCGHMSHQFVDALYDVLRLCSSLRKFVLSAEAGVSCAPLRMPLMVNLVNLTLNTVSLRTDSLEPMMRTARRIILERCIIDFSSEESASPSPLPNCLEGWARGLAQNQRIEELGIAVPRVLGRYAIETSDFARTLGSRPSLKRLALTSGRLGSSHGRLEFVFEPEDMRQLGLSPNLALLYLTSVGAGGLENFLVPRPSNLAHLYLEDDINATKEDFLELLDFLAGPSCKLRECRWELRLRFSSADVVDGDDERLRDPVNSYLDVLRHQNCTLISAPYIHGCSDLERRRTDFWCGMNKTCPNRLKLRQELSDAYPDQIAAYTSRGRYSQAYELIRSTFHLWHF